MSLKDLLNGLQPWDKDKYMRMGLSEKYIDMVNDANSDYRDYVLSKLNLNPTMSLHGGSIKLEFNEINNKLPMDKIITIIETYGEEFVTNQIGGGLFDWLKKFFRKRNFDTFKAQYDKLRDELDNKITQFEVESRGMKNDVEEHAKNMRELLLNGKAKVMMEIRLDNQSDMSEEEKKLIANDLELANSKEEQILGSIIEYDKLVKKKSENPKFWGFSFGSKSQLAKLSEDYQKSAKKFTEINKYFGELVNQTLEMKSLKAKYGSLTPDVKAKLTKSQIKEFEHWEKNKEQYAKIEAFNEVNMEETRKLIRKQGELNLLIDDYNRAFGKLDTQKNKATDVLNKWNSAHRSVFVKMGQCIALGMKYRDILETAKQLIVNNSNEITSLSITAVEPIIKEYGTHLSSVDYTSNLMNKLVATLGDIKNNFIKLVPSQNLQADILYVGSARTYLLTLIENIKRRQLNFSGGEKYLKDVIKGKIRGGGQIGGMYLDEDDTFTKYPLYFLHTYTQLIIKKIPGLPFNPSSVGYHDYTKFNTTSPAIPITDFIQEPYGIMLYDKDSTPGKTDIAKAYESFITKVDDVTSTILPIIDFEEEVIRVYEIKYNDISDIKSLDINTNHIKNIPINKRNHNQFIPFSYKTKGKTFDYFIYNIYTEDADEISTSKGKTPYYTPLLLLNSNSAILPVFTAIRSIKTMIISDEYHLLNPLTGLPILAIAKTTFADRSIEFDFKTQTDSTNMDKEYSDGKTKYYHFNAVGLEYKIDSNFKVNYNGTTDEQFRQGNVKLAELPDVIYQHWAVMYQLTIIINRLFNICLDTNTSISSKTVHFKSKNTRIFNDKMSEIQIGIGSINANELTDIKLKTMSTTDFMENFFGGNPCVSLILINKIINKELKLDDGTLVIDKTTKGIKGADNEGPVFGVIMPKADSLTPKQRQAMDYILRLIPKTSPYWTNQGKILSMLEDFFKAEYKDKFELELHAIQHLVYEIRTIEQDILKININIPNRDNLPKYSLITKDLEVKPNDLKLGEAGEVLTNAGKDLRSIVQHSTEFASKFAAELGVNESNIITLLEEDYFLNGITDKNNISFGDWLRNPSKPDRMKVLEYLENPTLVRQFYDQISKHPLYARHIPTICDRLTLEGGISKYNARDAYEFLRSHARNAGKRDDKKHDKKKQEKNPFFAAVAALDQRKGKPHRHHKKKE